jgi:hypothetical protein
MHFDRSSLPSGAASVFPAHSCFSLREKIYRREARADSFFFVCKVTE